MPIEATPTGLLARVDQYEPLRAFSQGGRYWDRVPQQLIREGHLAEFLPPVEVEHDDRGAYGRFHWERARRELLSHSKPLGGRGIPAAQITALQQAIEEFKLKPNQPAAQPQNRELIERFQLPDINRDPELYRLAGPWWDRRLQILWGCERTRNSSLPASAAVARLPIDLWYGLKRALTALSLLLLLLLSGWGLVWSLDKLRSLSSTAGHAQLDERTNADASEAQRDASRAGAGRNPPRHLPGDNRPPAPSTPSPALPAPNTPPSAAPSGSSKQPPKTVPGPGSGQVTLDPRAASRCQVVLMDQGEPQPDGTINVTLAVRTAASPSQPVPVETWYIQDQIVNGQDRLETRLKAGDHTVRATIQDSTGKRHDISASVTVEPETVITTPGKVSVKPR